MTTFAKKFTETKIENGALAGARILAAPFPSPGVVSIAGSIAGGTRAADALKSSREIPSVHAAMLMEGTRGKKKREIQLALDALGAQLSFGATADRLQFFARVPSQNVSKVLALVAEMLSTPAFPARELDVLKKRSLAGLALAAEDPRTQAGILLSRALYPKEHINFAETTEESRRALLQISAADLRRYHATSANAATLILAAAGDLEPRAFIRGAQKHFSQLPASKYKGESFVFTKESPLQTRRARVVKPIPGKASIDYMLGVRLGITDAHPDYPALMLGLRVLGNPSGSTGRLIQEVREKEGLTYGTFAYLSGFDGGADGHALAWATFAPQLFEKGRAGVRREVERIIRDGASGEDVRKHAELFAAQREVRMNDSASWAHAAHDTLVDGHPLSYLDEFPEIVKKLSQKEVNQALKKYLDLSAMSETAAGPVEKNALASLS